MEIKESLSHKPKSYPKEVLEIHREFNIAADNLLIEAKSIIAEAATKDISKVNRLESLGFKQVNQVTELKPLIQKSEMSKEQIELLNYYQLNYPNNKFITEEQVKTICYKYNLVCGDVSRFKGFVHEKNLKQIESFKLKEKDKFDINIPHFFISLHDKGIDKAWEYVKLEESDFDGTYWRYLLKNKSHYTEHALIDKSRFPSLTRIACSIQNEELVSYKFTLQICAPVKDMDISGLELKKGYKLARKIEIPDPVVLQPVNGGYLILTAWGDEASDELVVNQKFN